MLRLAFKCKNWGWTVFPQAQLIHQPANRRSAVLVSRQGHSHLTVQRFRQHLKTVSQKDVHEIKDIPTEIHRFILFAAIKIRIKWNWLKMNTRNSCTNVTHTSQHQPSHTPHRKMKGRSELCDQLCVCCSAQKSNNIHTNSSNRFRGRSRPRGQST